MTSQPVFDENSLIKLAERTEYEAWLLEAVYAIVQQELFPSWPDGVIYPVGKSKALFIGHGRLSFTLGDWRTGFLRAGAPLVFVSTFKLLDMLIEWILEENGVASTSRFKQKLKELNRPHIFPPVIESRTWLRERLVGLYSTLEPLRGTIIHDKHFTATDGAIQVASSKKGVGPLVEISASNLRMLAVTILSILKYVDGTWNLDDFQEKTLRHNLNELVTLHGLPSLDQKPPFHTCVRVYSTGSNPVLVDQMSIRSDLAAKYGSQDCSFDLRVLMVKDEKVVEAYFFPWSVCGSQGADWGRIVNVHEYRAAIPEDVQLEHLCNVG